MDVARYTPGGSPASWRACPGPTARVGADWPATPSSPGSRSSSSSRSSSYPYGTPPVERFWAKVDRSSGPDGCWPWTASRFTFGYGRFACQGRQHSAHRWVFEHLYGALPPGEIVRHDCDNPPCCNPAHLRSGTLADNNRDREERGRSGSGKINAAKTHCKRGHPYEGHNVYLHHGSRECRTCGNLRQRLARMGGGGDRLV